jgi:hypothetical protein
MRRPAHAPARGTNRCKAPAGFTPESLPERRIGEFVNRPIRASDFDAHCWLSKNAASELQKPSARGTPVITWTITDPSLLSPLCGCTAFPIARSSNSLHAATRVASFVHELPSAFRGAAFWRAEEGAGHESHSAHRLVRS